METREITVLISVTLTLLSRMLLGHLSMPSVIMYVCNNVCNNVIMIPIT